MLNFLMISIYRGTDTSQCSLTEENPGCGTSKKTGFLRLPPELRQKVYTHLLGPFKTHGFKTSILCVSKMIHKEAVKILYGENGVVLYHVHRNVLGQLRIDPQNDHDDFPSAFPVYAVTQADGRIGSEPALTVSIALQHPDQDSRWRDEFESYIGLASSIQGFARLLTFCHIRTGLHLRLYLPSVEYHKWEGRLDSLLNDFKDCRGVGTAEVFAAGGWPVESDLCSLMCKPLERFDEILNRARWYRERARQLLVDGGHHSKALLILARAYRFHDWWTLRGIELGNETEEKWTEYWDLRCETALVYACQLLHHRSPKEAREKIEYILGTYPLNSESAPVAKNFWDQKSTCYYVLGRCSHHERCWICALYNYLKALIYEPGHPAADNEIDKLEAAVGNSELKWSVIIRWNIKHVLGRFRHQPLLDRSLDADNHSHRGPADMTEDDLNRLVDSFVRPLACKVQGHSQIR